MGEIVFFVIVVGGTFFLTWRMFNLEHAQKSVFKKLAAKYGYTYSRKDDSQLLETLSRTDLNLIDSRGKSMLFNIIKGHFEASTVHAFTYKQEIEPESYNPNAGIEVSFTLVVIFMDLGDSFPVFSMIPNKGNSDESAGIRLASSDKFNEKYLLMSEDETFARGYFEPQAELLADQSILQHIYCDGKYIMFTYGGNCTGKVVTRRIESAHTIFKRLFRS